jgi:hypothetical protein
MTPNFSQTYFGKNEPFDLQVAREMVPGHSLINIFGYQPLVDGTSICIWENATPYVYPASAVAMTIVSNNAADIGVVKLISGLNLNYETISETIVINGTTPVVTLNSFLRINNVRTIFGNAIGTVTFTNNGTIYAKILPGIGQTQMSQYTVPAGYTFYLTRVDAFSQVSGGSNNYCTYNVQALLANGTSYSVLQAPFTANYNARRIVPFPYFEKTSLQWRATVAAQTAAVSMVIEGILIKNFTD